jgi:choline dehydrogenase
MAFMRAGQEMGAGHTDDMNGYRQEGFGPMDMNIRDGKRCSASAAYLTPILHQRPNLFTTSGIYCTKILFNKQRAIGVEFCRRPVTLELQTYADAAREKVYAEEAVILAGGAINTPQLLMISGIGPARHLKHELHLAVRQDTPGVGSNLQDHLEIHVQQVMRSEE